MAKIIPVPEFDFVVFGGTGDLAMRKLLPALYHRERDRQMVGASRVIAAARGDLTREAFASQVETKLKTFLGPGEFDPEIWARFAARLHYARVDAGGDAGWADLKRVLGEGTRVRVLYLATAPDLFGAICARAQAAGIINDETRVVLEKPIGRDLASARAINDQVAKVFAERRVFRIDHYLGKETVQNLLALRFANAMFEPIWDARHIDHVQITVAETVGLAGRAGYYDKSGALRDMVQNHLLQLLCLVAMEPPRAFEADAIRDEKLKVLRALGSIDAAAMVRGQYQAGAIAGEPVSGYGDELGAPSTTETFVALRAAVENWRWAGTPFYLRTGKRLQRRTSEIVIAFRAVPHNIFPTDAGALGANRLVVRLQPDEGIALELMTKDPGPGGMRLKAARLDLSFASTFDGRWPDAYERLLMDVVRGNPTLFMRRDEVEAAWSWVEPLLAIDGPPRPYIAGTWGPAAATALIERDGRTWREDA